MHHLVAVFGNVGCLFLFSPLHAQWVSNIGIDLSQKGDDSSTSGSGLVDFIYVAIFFVFFPMLLGGTLQYVILDELPRRLFYLQCGLPEVLICIASFHLSAASAYSNFFIGSHFYWRKYYGRWR